MTDYFDPDKNPPLPLIELPDRLNPFRDDDVRIYAKMLTCLPAQNVKALPGSFKSSVHRSAASPSCWPRVADTTIENTSPEDASKRAPSERQ